MAKSVTKKQIKKDTLLNQYKFAVDSSNVLSKTDKKGVITYANDEFCRLSGYSKDELIGKSHRIVRDPDTPKETFKNMWETISAKKIWKGIVKNRAKNGEPYYVDATIMPILDEEGEIKEYIGIRHDITKLVQTEEKLQLSRTDDLTQLFNRSALIEDLSNDSDEYVLAMIDITSFKSINDLYGYDNGDKLLGLIAQQMQQYFKNEKCSLYRVPIDVFTILFPKKFYSLKKVTHIMKEFVEYFRKYPKVMDYIHLYANAVVGIANQQKDIYHKADIAIQYAKKEKKSIVVFNEEINLKKELENNLYFNKILNEAIQSDKIFNHYQPIVNNKNFYYEKYEALVRIKDDKNKILTPFYFLDIAKNTSLYGFITKSVIRHALQTFQNIPNAEVSMNLTVEDIENQDIADFIFQTLQECSFTHRLVFEITESEEIRNYERVKDFIHKLKSFGCKIAIDDFGSGYSNFKYLMDINADYIKIDGSLIQNIDTDASCKAIVESITSFAQKMGIKTIAEFVESQEILDVVIALGVDYTQGFFFSPAIEKPQCSL